MTEPPPTTTDPPVDPVLRGRLTWLRPAERDDIGLFVRWLNDARTIRYLGARAPISHALEERWFDKMLEGHGHDRWFFVICRLGDDVAIGNCGLFAVDLRNGGAGLGISIGDPDDRNQGLGTDALEALVDFGFGQLRLERLWLDVYTWNARAMRSYEKAGFVARGHDAPRLLPRRRAPGRPPDGDPPGGVGGATGSPADPATGRRRLGPFPAGVAPGQLAEQPVDGSRGTAPSPRTEARRGRSPWCRTPPAPAAR